VSPGAGDARPVRVAILTVAATEGANAITDYVEQLCAALAAEGVEPVLVPLTDGRLSALGPTLRRIDAAGADVVHVQHPVSFARRSYVPQLLSLLRPGVVTLHGGSLYGLVGGKVSLGPFFLRSRHVVFTTDYERRHALRWGPWMRGRSSVIPIGANLPGRPSEQRREREVVTFGLIRPGKGIEDALRLAALFRDAGTGWRVRVVGQVPPAEAWYEERIRREGEGLPVDWVVGLDHEATAHELGQAAIAYLPFPDGASERRGSLLATLGGGAPTITTRGSQTPEALGEAVLFAPTPEEALAAVFRLANDAKLRDRLATGAAQYLERFEWESIAARHAEVYRTLARRA